MKFTKLLALLFTIIILMTGCNQNTPNTSQNTASETQTEIIEAVSPADTAKQLPKDKLFSMNIPISDDDDIKYRYEWRVIGSTKGIDDLALFCGEPIEEFYEWCSGIDFKKEIIFVDFCSSGCKPDNAYVYNGMVDFVCTHDTESEEDKIAVIAAAIPREDMDVLMYEVQYFRPDLDGVYIFGSYEAMEYCSSKFISDYWAFANLNYEKYDINGKRLAEWGKGVDFDKYAVALKVEWFGSSSYVETLKDGVYVQNEEIIFDYEVTCPYVQTCDSQAVFCMGIVPKEQLGFLEIVDPLGIKVTTEEAYPQLVKLLFEQYGGENIGNLFIDSSYTLEKFESGNGWVQIECPTIPDDEEAVLAEFGRTEYYQIFGFDNMLTPGKYRIGKPVINRRSDEDFEEIIYYANFTVTEEDYEYYSSKNSESLVRK